jgi:osmotically-inducible protein OsmY
MGAVMNEQPDEYVVGHIKEALSSHPGLGELHVEVTVARGDVYLSGELPTEERRRTLEEVVREIAPERTVHNATTVERPTKPAAAEELV